MIVTAPTQELVDRLRAELPVDVDVQLWPMDGPCQYQHVELAVLPYMAAASVVEVAQPGQVDVVQSQSLGYDNVADYLRDGVAFCNAVDVHEDATAELAVMLIVAAQRELPSHLRDAGQWNQVFSPGLLGATVLIVGVGGVGQAIRRRLEPFDVTILRSASRARSDKHGKITGPQELEEQLAIADIVVLATPLTEQTRHLINAERLAQMKPGALLVNIGRGALVDTDALVTAATENRVRAALDVVDPEPLPANHPLWKLPGVLITPHVGGRVTSMEDRVIAVVAGQVQRLRRGEQVAHRVL